MLETAAQLLSHRKGQRELASIVKEGVKLLIAKTKKERFGIGAAPRATKQAPPTQEETRHIPKASVRETVERDGLQCTFVADDGHRCEERSLLQLEHKEGFARTRRHTALTVLCATHNAYQADLLYGREFMDARRHRVSFQNESAPTAASIVRAASSTSAATGDSPP